MWITLRKIMLTKPDKVYVRVGIIWDQANHWNQQIKIKAHIITNKEDSWQRTWIWWIFRDNKINKS